MDAAAGNKMEDLDAFVLQENQWRNQGLSNLGDEDDDFDQVMPMRATIHGREVFVTPQDRTTVKDVELSVRPENRRNI